MCNLNYNPNYLHYHLVHEFCHGLVEIITIMFFCCFLALPKIQTRTSLIHIPTLDDYVVANEGRWKIEQFFNFFLLPPHVLIGHQQSPNYEKQMFLNFWHAYKLWNKTNHFFHIKLNIFLITYMLIKKIPRSNK